MPTGFEKAIFPEYRRFLTYLRIHLPPSLRILFSVIHCRNLLLCSHIPPFPPVPDSHCFHLPPFHPVPDSHCFHLPPFPFPPGGKSSFQWRFQGSVELKAQVIQVVQVKPLRGWGLSPEYLPGETQYGNRYRFQPPTQTILFHPRFQHFVSRWKVRDRFRMILL